MQRMKAMESFYERVELSRELDEAKRNLAKRAEGRLIVMTETKWNSLTPSTVNFLLDHNGHVVQQRREAEIQATINARSR